MGREQDLLLRIYDTVVEPDTWPAVLDSVAEAVGASGCIMFDLDTDADGAPNLNATHLSSNYDRKAVAQYLNAFSSLEIEDQKIFARHSAAGDAIQAIPDSVLAESPQALAARPNARAMAEQGIWHRAGALLSKDQPLRDRFSVQFSRGHGPLGPADLQILARILPHMAKAAEIALPVRQLERKGRYLAEAMDRLKLGVCLIRHDGAIVAMNDEFRRQIDALRVFRRTPNGRLEPTAPEDRAWFAQMTNDARNHGKFGARPRKEALGAQAAADRAVAVEVAPLRSQNAFGEARLDGYMVYGLDTSRSWDLDVGMVEKVMGLTASEAALVGLMADGLTNRQIADIRERSVDTINTQVKSLLSKANCANRTQFIRRASHIGAQFVTRDTPDG
ncbi:helix-turn-helix domain-containing protein [Maribius pontilimi]|uniref:Helix-turn-helix domain-containing protein n=1 Tax=Palleronia pontilimi TaxID=1964209 RepID=A0A934MG10_9RHOB|nr:helix-turn-helix domain-containing protein [Palleronia pontilimi]MBJ3761944.1 helix-turn-helix domain-containing protein [Palleronia pontilimi]